MTSINWPAVGASILPNIGGWLGGIITAKNVKTWYKDLNKPDWRPPNWAFGPVWTALYTSMGYASYLVWRDGGGFDGPARLPLTLFATQLALNWAWTPIFFGCHNLKGGLLEILALDVAVLATANAFKEINSTAGLIFLPYIAWLSVATALNYVVWRDNPKKAGNKPSKKAD